ncbi:oligosaccharide flippase family protein [Paenibacillus rhizovicinus]|uniref:Oligosaccharide flippase family protein n=1 Tax=Paenibacillus rhizovicinus TaxID=2704463 RepID=A0A6C0PC59_9BACL|nr:oligosaccharide flippase family protein [Paenibacillus rhizovicinus]QHW34312.1 oligosaccharide flippase family protein [Paenibacillus rhizovicinus]
MANAQQLAAAPSAAPSAAKALAKGGSLTFLINVSGMGLALLMQIVLARLLGAAGYGTFAYVTTVTTFMIFPAKLGFDTTIVKLVSSYKAKDNWPLIKGLIQRSNQIGFVLSLIVMAVGLTVVAFRSGGMTESQIVCYAAGMVTIPLLTLATLRQSALQALKDVLYAQMPEKIIRPVLTIGLLALAVPLVGGKADAGLAMICFAAALAVSYIIGAVVLKRRIGQKLKTVEPQYETREWTRLSLSLMVNAGMYLILGQLNVLLMGAMDSETASGYFSAAVRLATLVAFARTAINMTAAPLLSETYAKGDREQLQQVCTTSGRAGFTFAVVVCAVFAIGGKPILSLFGAGFTDAYPALLLMSLGQLFGAYCGQNGTLATMAGSHNLLTRVLAGSTVLNIVMSAALIPWIGMTGAGLAACCSTVCWNGIMAVVVVRKYGIITPVWLPVLGSKRKK